ncbi:MAG TPA: dipeptidase [Vicinamibacteria bacterium]|nr:dipeptidase [Vicinamibacteria bacterium]
MLLQRLVLVAALSAAALAFPSRASAPAAEDPALARARAVLKRVPLIDGHNDYPWEVHEKADGDILRFDLTKPQPELDTDFARLRAGGVGGQFWSVYVPSSLPGPEAVRATLEAVDLVRRMVERWPDTLELATTAREVEAAFARGRIASLMGMEGGHSIDSSLGALRAFAGLGVRYMTLTHSDDLPWASAASLERASFGLTRFGEEVVREMNRTGMLVDLSHVSVQTMRDALRVSEAPVIFSHSSARAVCDHPRNAPDDVLRELPRNGGVIMVTFVPSFVAPDGAQHARAAFAERTRLRAIHRGDDRAVSKGMEAWFRANPGPKATLAQVADHVDHLRRVIGIDHIGIGSDFDGTSQLPEGLEDVSKYPALLAELLRRGYSDDDVEKIAGRNLLRVLARSEQVAVRLRAERSPSVATRRALDGSSGGPPAR